MNTAIGKRPYSIRIFLPGGTPDGLKLVEKSNWTGQGIVCPRALLAESRDRGELGRTGIYILTGPSETGGDLVIYIGEGDPLLPRLESHNRSKNFWTQAICFTSKDGNLNKAHIQYLESRLITLAQEAKRCSLDNGNSPTIPTLSEADKADMDGFLAEILAVLPLLGVDAFEKPEQLSTSRTMFFLTAKGFNASGYESGGGFVLQAGSCGPLDVGAAMPSSLAAKRISMQESGLFAEEDDHIRLTEDYTFNSPSAASTIILGRSSNGRGEWKTQDGITLKELQSADQSNRNEERGYS